MSNAYKLNEEVKLKVVARNYKDNEKINVKLTFLDENKKELGIKEDVSYVKDYKAIYPFIIENVAKEKGINPDNIAYVKGWMDADGDGKIDYGEEVWLEVETCPHKIDGAIKVAEYIVSEIKKNTNSQIAHDMRYWNDYRKVHSKKWDEENVFSRPLARPGCSAFKAKALAKWYEKVNDDCDWDHKPKIQAKFPADAVAVILPPSKKFPNGQPCSYCYHKYKDYDYFYDVWSNIHYGYVGMACGFSETVLILGSGAQQLTFSGSTDTNDDIESMKLGISLYKKFNTFALDLKVQDILDALESCKLTESRQIHWCKNLKNPERLK